MSSKLPSNVRPIIFNESVAAAAGMAGAIADNSSASQTIAVDGVKIGDFVKVSASVTLSSLIVSGKVTVNGSVVVTYGNLSGGGITPGAHTIYVRVERRAAAVAN